MISGLRSTVDGIVNLHLPQGTSPDALLDFDDGGVLWLFGFDTDRMQLTGQTNTI